MMYTCDLAGLITCAPPDARVVIPDWVAALIRERAENGERDAIKYAARLEKVPE